ncbi:hypothetical protein VT52_033415 [Streptomyces malaysiense]|uniref:Uncharacterized protein n=1 Tax=Streptomyces malaysiense TaxID=1428626 RepID=A0A1J4PQT1_9ACTN|nr:hypothetical protein VT52_033415 [Streptomyces malaysiense]
MARLVDEVSRRFTPESVRPPARPADQAHESRRHALLRLRVLSDVKRAVRHLEDQAAHAAAESGAGYPEIGRAVSMSRQGARRRWPGLISSNTNHPSHRPPHRST